LNLAESFKKQMESQKNTEIIEGDLVSEIKKNKEGFKIFTKKGKKIDSKTVLIVSGSRRKKINVPGEKEFDGRGVFYCSICDAPLMRNKTVAVIGGGNSGFEAVLDLLPYASKIYLLEYTDILSADVVTQEKINSSAGGTARKMKKVEIITLAEAREISGEEFVKELKYKDRRNGNIKKLNIQGVFVSVGYQPNSEIFKGLVDLNKNNEIIIDPKTQKTSCEGIWAAGDVTDGLYRQINIAIGDAVKATLNIDSYLYALSMKRSSKKK